MSACVKILVLMTQSQSFFLSYIKSNGGFSATTLQAYRLHCLHIKVCKNISVFQLKPAYQEKLISYRLAAALPSFLNAVHSSWLKKKTLNERKDLELLQLNFKSYFLNSGETCCLFELTTRLDTTINSLLSAASSCHSSVFLPTCSFAVQQVGQINHNHSTGAGDGNFYYQTTTCLRNSCVMPHCKS